MPIQSMTGYARVQSRDDRCSWTWEVKSVNARGLDTRFRLPGGYDRLDPAARKLVAERFKRGSFSFGLTLTFERTGAAMRLNGEVLDEVAQSLPELRKRFPDLAPPSVDGLLGIRGVLEQVEEAESPEQEAERDAALLATLAEALDGLVVARGDEGSRLEAMLRDHVARLAALQTEAEALNEHQATLIHDRLHEQVAALLDQVPALPEDRLAQEAAVLMTKADPREELDRLRAHTAAATELLDGGGAIGRKLDFLCQEFNRESNTLCAKSQDQALTRVGLDMKAVIDQLREQVQNVE